MDQIIDLRSDTFTVPDKAMLEAMFSAKVGDDVFGEDPTVNALEEISALMFGKEAALYCPSGTMSNQIAIKTLSSSPGEVICEKNSHVYQYEGGGIAFHSGLSVALPESDNGILNAIQVEQCINADDLHKPATQLLVLENTHNRGGGSCYELSEIKKIKVICDLHGLNMHLDGARIFNAITTKGYSALEVAALFDTVSVSLSKGLGAPVGSVLVGSKINIDKARRLRKLMGGGMRQAGYLAAAGIYALENNIPRLQDDHRRAAHIEKVLENLHWVSDVLPVQSNIVVFKLVDESEVEKRIHELKKGKILAVPFGKGRIRMVTHLGISDNMLDELEVKLRKIY